MTLFCLNILTFLDFLNSQVLLLMDVVEDSSHVRRPISNHFVKSIVKPFVNFNIDPVVEFPQNPLFFLLNDGIICNGMYW